VSEWARTVAKRHLELVGAVGALVPVHRVRGEAQQAAHHVERDRVESGERRERGIEVS
jgi:hypothetical protein